MSNDSRKHIHQVENLLLFATSGMSLVISLLDLSGLMDSSSAVAQRIPSLTLLCVGFIAGYLILERRSKLDEIAKSVSKNAEEILREISGSRTEIIQSIGSIEVSVFNSRGDFAQAFADRIEKATRVDDLVWSNVPTEAVSRKDLEAVSRYSSTVNEVLRKPDTIWREIAVLTEKRFQRSEGRILDKSIKGFNMGYVEMPFPDEIPRISFIIIDNEDVFLAHLPGAENLRLRIRHPEIVNYFAKYYEAMWKSCIKIKQGETVDYERLEEQRKKWSTNGH